MVLRGGGLCVPASLRALRSCVPAYLRACVPAPCSCVTSCVGTTSPLVNSLNPVSISPHYTSFTIIIHMFNQCRRSGNKLLSTSLGSTQLIIKLLGWIVLLLCILGTHQGKEREWRCTREVRTEAGGCRRSGRQGETMSKGGRKINDTIITGFVMLIIPE